MFDTPDLKSNYKTVSGVKHKSPQQHQRQECFLQFLKAQQSILKHIKVIAPAAKQRACCRSRATFLTTSRQRVRNKI